MSVGMFADFTSQRLFEESGAGEFDVLASQIIFVKSEAGLLDARTPQPPTVRKVQDAALHFSTAFR